MSHPRPLIVQGDARTLPLVDESVDLIVTSPPYFGQRDYRDGGTSLAGQIGSEPTLHEYVDELINCTREWMRILKPTGSMWINLGDTYMSRQFGYGATTGGSWAKVHKHIGDTRNNGQVRLDVTGGKERSKSELMTEQSGIPRKSLMNLPHRYAIRCVDELGLTLRQDQVWKKANGLPESVTDRTRREHEYLFHFVKQPRYYSAVDEIREEYDRYRPGGVANGSHRIAAERRSVNVDYGGDRPEQNPLGKLPGSVWEFASQALNVPDHVMHARCCGGRRRAGCEDGIDHYAAFPFALVRPIILGWSPREVCTVCGHGRRPLAASYREHVDYGVSARRAIERLGAAGGTLNGGTQRSTLGHSVNHSITGYACACPDTTAPSIPGVVLDPFGGTASAPLVAAMLGRIGISVDASWDYGDLIARWRCNDPKERARALGLDPAAVTRVPAAMPGQDELDLFGEAP